MVSVSSAARAEAGRYLVAGRGVVGLDGGAALGDVGGVEELGDGVVDVVGVAEVGVAVGVEAAHGFGFVVVGGGGAGAAALVAGGVEDAEHLEDADAAGAGRGRGDDVVAVVVAFEGLALDGVVVAEVGEGDQASVGGFGGGDLLGGLAVVEAGCALLRDAGEGLGELGLLEGVVPGVFMAVAEEDAFGLGVFGEGVGVVVEGVGLPLGDGEAVRGELDGGLEERGPGGVAVSGVGECEAADGSGNAGGAPAVDGVLGGVALGVEVHVVRGLCGGGLAEVDEGGASVGEADEHEAAAAEVAGEGMGDGEGEADSHGGIDGVATGFEDGDADVGRERLLGDDHAGFAVDGVVGAGGGGDQGEEQEGGGLRCAHDAAILRQLRCPSDCVNMQVLRLRRRYGRLLRSG